MFWFRAAGDVLLATAFLSYSGPFNQEFRNLLLGDWKRELRQRHIPFGNNLNLTELLIDAPTVSEWNLQVRNPSKHLNTCVAAVNVWYLYINQAPLLCLALHRVSPAMTFPFRTASLSPKRPVSPSSSTRRLREKSGSRTKKPGMSYRYL